MSLVSLLEPATASEESERFAAFQVARSQWPMIVLTFPQFDEHLARLGHADTLPPYPGSVYLCAACALGMNNACKVLDRQYFPAIFRSLAQCGQASDFPDEVLQQMRERLFGGPEPRIAGYRGNGPLGTWLRTVASHLALDHLRSPRLVLPLRVAAKLRAEEDSREPVQLAAAIDESREGAPLRVLEELVQESVARLSQQDRDLLGLHYFQDVSAEEIADRLAVYRSTVYRRIHRAEQRLGKGIKERFGARFGLAERVDFNSLRPCCADLDLRGAFLSTPPAPTLGAG